MNILLDTHVALWAIVDSPKIKMTARKIIESRKNSIWISAATLWEIAIKHALNREHMPLSSEQALRYFRRAGYHILPIEPEHVLAVEDLPNHHNDPFDRLLVAQALAEPMRLMTRDRVVAKYSDTIIRV